MGIVNREWPACDAAGRALAKGAYSCVLRAGEFRQTEKLVLQR